MYPTVLEALNKWAIEQPNNIVWNFLDDKGEIIDKYTYYELEIITNELAKYLLTFSNIKVNDRVLLVFYPGLYFTISLIACFKANLIAVPVFPPDPRKLKKDLNHFVSIQSNSNANVVLTHNLYNYSKKLTELQNIFSLSGNVSWPNLKWITVDDVINKSKASKVQVIPKPIQLNRDSIAFLQYTSGSTSDPKGVMISHSNLSHNLTLIVNELKANQSTRNVAWLPQYHDMGLIGSYLGLLYCGGIGFYLSPISFLKDPLVWIKALSKYQGTHTQAPSFAYALVVRKYKEFISSR